MASAPRPPRARRPKADEPDVEIVVEAVAPSCNVCPEPPEWRGLCSAHRQTHRGLADLKGA